jgi:cysteine desulfurase/selenocysteine lyase
MEPYQGGGEMIELVELDRATYKPPPHKFEAGTPSIGDAVGLAAAMRYLGEIGVDRIQAHEHDLLDYALECTRAIPGFLGFGPEKDRAAVLSFALGDLHPHDVAQILNDRGIAVRAGHHCNQPLMKRMGLSATTRASFYLYNDREDIEALCDGLRYVIDFFS